MLRHYVLLDLETTGGNPVHDRVTEVAAVRIQDGIEVERWSTLVNPQTRIPAFIASLTGITDAMVAGAPFFETVAPRLLEMLGDAVLVAHNARFDHGFLLGEFARLGHSLRVKTLCTVRLSRKLYPQHKGHGLDAIMQRHGISTKARHRAMGDVDAVLDWLRLATGELGAERVRAAAQELMQASASLPPHLQTAVGDVPQSAGVYLFYGEGPAALYIGKSVNMRSRVMAHFQGAGREAREMRIHQETRRIEWRSTAGEFGALLLEARLVKELKPVYNRQLRRERQLAAWRLADAAGQRPLLELVRAEAFEAQQLGQLYGVYRSKRQALETLRAIAQTHGLCLQALGLESGSGRCFANQIGQCRGLCVGLESTELHRLRLEQALASQRLRAWPFSGAVGWREHDPDCGRTDIHLFSHWCHLATVRDESELHDALQARTPLAFDLDSYRLLVKRLLGPAAPQHLLRLG